MLEQEIREKAEIWVKENMDCCRSENCIGKDIPYFDEEERVCAKSAYIDGAKEMYNKAIDDVLEVAKGYGLISSEVGFSDLMAYENNEISEDVLWMRFDDNALRELKMAVEDLRQKID